MPTEREANRERRALRNRANQMQRAVAAIALALDALTPQERIIVLNEVANTAIAEHRAARLDARRRAA